MKLITLHITKIQQKNLDKLVNRGLYPNCAEAIRFAINDLIEFHTPICIRCGSTEYLYDRPEGLVCEKCLDEEAQIKLFGRIRD